MAKNPFQEIRNTETPDRSVRWYQDQIRNLGLNTITPTRALRSDIGEIVSLGNIEPGDMYLFMYDPKTKEQLQYYDTVPLSMVFDVTNKGFHGINFHYLPPLLRMQLLGKMLEFTNTKNISERSKFLLKWSTLKSASRFPGIKACVKQYLFEHVKSRVLKINPEDWKKTIMLPLDNFEKKNRTSVFRESRRMM